MDSASSKFWTAIAVCGGLLCIFVAANKDGFVSQSTAAWVQAVGSIAAIVGATGIASRQAREAREREQRDRAAADRDRRELLLARQSAAVTLMVAAKIRVKVIAASVAKGNEISDYTVGSVDSLARSLCRLPIEIIHSGDAIFHYSQVCSSMEVLVTHLRGHIKLYSQLSADGRKSSLASLAETLKAEVEFLDSCIEGFRSGITPGS